MLVAGFLTSLQDFSLYNPNLMCYLNPFLLLKRKKKHIFKSPENDLYRMLLLPAEKSLFVCYLTELFTMNKHALYCKDVLYPVALCNETTLFDTMQQVIVTL